MSIVAPHKNSGGSHITDVAQHRKMSSDKQNQTGDNLQPLSDNEFAVVDKTDRYLMLRLTRNQLRLE